ncbi:hypothetical protein Tco_1540769 [Tanacetum coccineum]
MKNRRTLRGDGITILCDDVKVYKRQRQRNQDDPKKTYEEDLESGIVMVKMPSCMSFLGCINAYDEPVGNLDKMGDEVENPSPQSTPQVLPSFEVIFDEKKLWSS